MTTTMVWSRTVSSVSVIAGLLALAACGSTSDGSSGTAGAGGSVVGAAGGAGAAGSHSGGTTSTSGGASGTGGTSGGTASGGTSAVAGSGGASAGAGGASGAGVGASGGGAGAASCSASMDPLKTGNAKVDAYDCAVIAVASKYGMPDPMIVKSQIQQESNFEIFAISGDSPCGTKSGWTDAESKSFGLIQTTPACGEAKSALLPNGHPNLTQDMGSALWATSVFNPPINLDEGVKTDADSRKALMVTYPGCSAVQYNMMAAGAFNSGTDAVLGCGKYNQRAQNYVDAITGHYHGFAASAGWPDPY